MDGGPKGRRSKHSGEVMFWSRSGTSDALAGRPEVGVQHRGPATQMVGSPTAAPEAAARHHDRFTFGISAIRIEL